jgi:hypothetical protein
MGSCLVMKSLLIGMMVVLFIALVYVLIGSLWGPDKNTFYYDMFSWVISSIVSY